MTDGEGSTGRGSAPQGAAWGDRPAPPAPPRRGRRLPGSGLPEGTGSVADLGVGGRVSYRLGARNAAAVRSGAAADRPVTVFCHLLGEDEPYPRRWRFGQMTIGRGAPTWRPLRGGRRAELTLPDGTRQSGPVRPVQRSELSMFCPNPRRSVVVPLQTPEGALLVGVAREHADTVVAAFARRPRSTRSPRS